MKHQPPAHKPIQPLMQQHLLIGPHKLNGLKVNIIKDMALKGDD